ncbi:MAG: O-antigen ligase family protein [Planctomycetaceae bacterium]
MATNFWPWIIGLAAAYPLAWEALQINGRPVDVVASDLLIMLILLVPMGGSLRIPAGVSLKRLATVRVAAVVFMLYALGLAFTVYGGTADMSRIVSASKLTKPIFFVLLGTYIARTVPPLIALKRVGTAFALIVFATIGSAVLSPGFPRTAFGANLFGTRLYGYPNSAMSFYAVMLPLLIASADTKSRGMRRWFYYGAIGFTALIVVSSLSRSSTLVMVFGGLTYLFITGRGHVPIVCSSFVAVGVVASAGLLFNLDIQNEAVLQLKENVEKRYSQTVGAEDPLSGRAGIWADTLGLAADRPIFGYAFESYHHHSTFDTPHQQYLEILYKTGGLGLVLYFWLLFSALGGVRHLSQHVAVRSDGWYFLKALFASFAAAMVGNLSQPNLTYSITGNCLFLMVGLMLNRNGAASLVDPPSVPASVGSTPLGLPQHSFPGRLTTPQGA